MTPYEYMYLAAMPFLPVLYGRVRHDVGRLVAGSGGVRPQVLDVGGRKSPYTVGFPADITVLDIPRISEVQESLALGVNEEIMTDLRRRRSNIGAVVLQDMTRCTLPSGIYDGIICVEVIEHVLEDDAFVHHIARVLKPGGWLYLTTPNGDYIRNIPPDYNPDHVRHYHRDELGELLSRHFDQVQIAWGVKVGIHRKRGLRPFSLHHPVRTAQAMASNVINHWESRGLDEQSRRTAHLFAIAR